MLSDLTGRVSGLADTLFFILVVLLTMIMIVVSMKRQGINFNLF
jgi:uncharacterized membrane protein YtjA (UPF0391 family)